MSPKHRKCGSDPMSSSGFISSVLENLQPSPSISSDIFQLFVIPMVPWPCAGPSLGAPWSCSSAPRLRFPQWPVPHWTFNERLKKRGRSYFIIVLSNNICIYIYILYIYIDIVHPIPYEQCSNPLSFCYYVWNIILCQIGSLIMDCDNAQNLWVFVYLRTNHQSTIMRQFYAHIFVGQRHHTWWLNPLVHN